MAEFREDWATLDNWHWRVEDRLSHGHYAAREPTLVPTGGNPGAYIEVTLTATATLEQKAEVWIAYFYEPSRWVPIHQPICRVAMNIDLANQPADDVFVGMALEQSGSLYRTLTAPSEGPAPWTKWFGWTEGDFERVAGAGPEAPNLVGGEDVRFGFIVGNSISLPGPSKRTQAIDTWRVALYGPH